MAPLKLMFSKKNQTLTGTYTKYLRIQNTAEIAFHTVSFSELNEFTQTTNNFEIE